MKHCSRRLMALLLSAILCVQLLPAMARAEEGTAAASEGKGAFGLPAATGLTAGSTEYNSAVADALLLSRVCERVILVHRRDTLRATKIYHEPLMNAENVEFRWNSTVTELLHGETVNGIRLRDVRTGEESVVECDGVFVSVGRNPATKLVKGQIDLDSAGYIVADESTKTNLPGVFAVGDVRTKALRQVVTAVADGAIAVHYAEEYLAENW